LACSVGTSPVTVSAPQSGQNSVEGGTSRPQLGHGKLAGCQPGGLFSASSSPGGSAPASSAAAPVSRPNASSAAGAGVSAGPAAAAGTVITVPHCGQRTFLPASAFSSVSSTPHAAFGHLACTGMFARPIAKETGLHLSFWSVRARHGDVKRLDCGVCARCCRCPASCAAVFTRRNAARRVPLSIRPDRWRPFPRPGGRLAQTRAGRPDLPLPGRCHGRCNALHTKD